jgi:hypothetical protein
LGELGDGGGCFLCTPEDLLKGTFTRFLTLGFFHQTIPPWALINSVDYTAETVSEVSMTPLKQNQRCQWDCWIPCDGEVKNINHPKIFR